MANEFKIKNGLIVSGSAEIEQDLIVRGTLTVDELHTSITSSSILYESGSTVFGNTLDDTHQLTGSVAITGSITLNGQAIGTGKLDEITFNSYTSSINTTIKNKLDNDNVISGSVQVNITGTTGYSTFSSSISTSIGELSSSVATTTSGLTSTITSLSSSLTSSIGSLSSSVASINNTQNGRLDLLETASGSIRSDFNSFTSSYTTGAFTGSFKGDGSQLYNIPSSGVTGLNLSKIISGSVSASISPDRGLEINTNTIISGALSISGTTTLGGNIVPLTPRGATLGTLELPFADIFVSSGSINIAGIVGQPNTTLSNVSGNILISAGGMQLIGSGAFNAATGSFQFISGSMEQVGDYHQTGDYELIGNKAITGSLTVSGSQTLIGTQILRGDKIVTGSISISGSQTFIGDQSLLGNKSITGSLNLSGSLNISGLITGATTDNIVTYNPTTKAVGSITGITASQIPVRYYGAFYDLTTQTGATNVSGSVRLGNTQHANGVSVVSGSRVTVANAGVYNLQFSTQLYRDQGGTRVNTYFWFRVNGVNVPNSNTIVTTMTNNGYTVASWNYVDVYNAGDYVELMWMPDGAHVSLIYVNSPEGLPSIPSTILTLTQV